MPHILTPAPEVVPGLELVVVVVVFHALFWGRILLLPLISVVAWEDRPPGVTAVLAALHRLQERRQHLTRVLVVAEEVRTLLAVPVVPVSSSSTAEREFSVARYALIDKSGLVLNVIEWDGKAPYELEADQQLIQSDAAGTQWRYVNGTFNPPSDQPERPE